MNDTLSANVFKAYTLQEKRFNADILKYKNDINQVLAANSTNPNDQRMLLGKLFICALKQEMGHGLVKAGIFGSTARGEAKETSDVDITLFIQALTTEEEATHNTFDRQFERGYGAYAVFNVAHNSHRIDELQNVFSKTTGIPVRSMRYDYNAKDYSDIQKEINFIPIVE